MNEIEKRGAEKNEELEEVSEFAARKSTVSGKTAAVARIYCRQSDGVSFLGLKSRVCLSSSDFERDSS